MYLVLIVISEEMKHVSLSENYITRKCLFQGALRQQRPLPNVWRKDYRICLTMHGLVNPMMEIDPSICPYPS